MKRHDFGEKSVEYSVKQRKEIPVWVSPKFVEARKKAIEMIDSEKYGLSDSDFWILMNETKSGKMGYTGLIISHNGCLKINAALPAEKKFRPSCVSLDKEGYNESLVYSYCNDEQGIYEVGEVAQQNCKNPYPYAMAFKRLFDRVVLKTSELAFSGVYGEDEGDEFKRSVSIDPKEQDPENNPLNGDDLPFEFAQASRVPTITKEQQQEIGRLVKDVFGGDALSSAAFTAVTGYTRAQLAAMTIPSDDYESIISKLTLDREYAQKVLEELRHGRENA